VKLQPTASQTIGPFFAVMRPLANAEMVSAADTDAISVRGTIHDGAGEPIPDALVEAWQANTVGRYVHPEDIRELPLTPGFTGYGRCLTGAGGEFSFVTVKPGRVPYTDERLQAPHVTLTLFARGLLRHLRTRVYFDDESAANAEDPVLASISDSAVRATLIAKCAGRRTYVFDIHLQGESETAFFDI
jgi:protocatechuate 3,4-dioxygenase, alpha subunit